MRPLADLEAAIARLREGSAPAPERAGALLAIGEEILEQWIGARGEPPTAATREGFRLLALHRQGTRGDPSFNACRESCREIVYHYNLIALGPQGPEAQRHVRLMAMVVMHLLLFVGGKLQNARLGEFCCSARPLREHTT